MPTSAFARRHFSPDGIMTGFDADTPVKDASTLLNFDHGGHFVHSDSDPMIFGPLDFEDAQFHESSTIAFPLDPFTEDIKPTFTFSGPPSGSTNYDFDPSHTSPNGSYYDSGGLYGTEELKSPVFDNNLNLDSWISDPDVSPMCSPSSPIPIPSNTATLSPPFVAYVEHHSFPNGSSLSPTGFAALHPLPASVSPSTSFEDQNSLQGPQMDSVSPQDVSLYPPTWASQLWDTHGSLRTPSSSRSSVRHSPLNEHTGRRRIPRRDSLSSAQTFHSSSAPSVIRTRAASMSRSYSRRSESVADDRDIDRDATVRRRKRSSAIEDVQSTDKANEGLPLKSVLRPPKLAPSAWQLYFTDWIQRQQASNTRKLNVAQAAKEAGQEYACLSAEEKEPYKRRSQAMKDIRERELSAYMHTLTPEDIKRENAFRAAQRKAGKSRKSNIKDPNAPKKPLSAYFMFLQQIRSNQSLVQEIFGDETETTKQSVLAAAKWRSMTDEERKPFLAQAEQEKMEYEAARRLYEEGTTGFGSSINFSIYPRSPAFQTIKVESESESEGFTTDDGFERYIRS